MPVPALVNTQESAPERLPEPAFSMFDSSVPAGPKKSRWPWVVAWAVVLIALAVFSARYFLLRPDIEPLALTVLEHEGQLQIGWNHAARPVVSAPRGSVEISDGGENKLIALTAADLQRGNLTYQRHSGDVEIRLVVEGPGGEKFQEASRFLGKPPEKSEPAATAVAPAGDLGAKRDNLAEENNRLRIQVGEQAQRIQQLERIVKIMQTRQGEGQQ
jgi:hypothetical protein